jgi:GNAT superfamily N-acetyltransferase
VEDDVARAAVAVRDAAAQDVPDLLVMWRELRELGNRNDRSTPQPSAEALHAWLEEAGHNADLRFLVAVVDEELVGMAVLSHQPFATLFDCPAVSVHALHVRSGHRRRGVGRALVSSAAAYADARGADQLITNVYPHLRETNRFYARLGFGPVLVRRSASVATLRRKLAADSRTGLDEVLQRRRSLRSRSRVRAALVPTRSVPSATLPVEAPPVGGR